VRRIVTAVPQIPGRVAEFVPPREERCGKSPRAGAVRVLSASLRQLRHSGSTAVVALAGSASVVVDLGTPHGRRLYAYGFCEPASRAMRSLLRTGDVVIDGGANIGLFTVLAAARVGPEGRVIACEPSSTTMQLLRDNVARNGFEHVALHEVALAAKPGRLSLQVFAPGSGFSSFAPADSSTANRVDVEVTTLDELAGDLVDRTNLVKLDVEGAELRALEGASRLLERARPDFIVELEPEHLERQGSTIAEVQALFGAADYVGCAIGPEGLEPIRGDWHRPAGDPNIVVRPREREAG